jgi:hypothetical protein
MDSSGGSTTTGSTEILAKTIGSVSSAMLNPKWFLSTSLKTTSLAA